MRTRFAALVAAGSVLALGACGGGTDEDTVRFALDWTPNTNHLGLYVALEKGWFDDAGIDVEILPYNDVLPDQLIDAGRAEAGISFQDSSILAQAAGADVVAVLAPLQHWATAIGVRADDASITRPRDLDGRTYAGFGGPSEVPVLEQVIRNDGGRGELEVVTLGTSAYEALYSGDADLTIPFIAWEGIEAERSGTPMKYFRYTDYGFPDAYAVLVDAGRAWIDAEPEQAKAFVSTLQRGYAWAADHPAEAAEILLDAEPEAFSDPDLVRESAALLARDHLRAEDGTVGTMTAERWAGYGSFLVEHGIVTDPDGDPLTTEPDWSTFFTTALLDD